MKLPKWLRGLWSRSLTSGAEAELQKSITGRMYETEWSPEREREKLLRIVHRLYQMTLRDCSKIIDDINAENKGTIDDVLHERRENEFLLMGGEHIAQRLWDKWSKEEREGITVEEGYCILDHKTWFRVAGDPKLVEEPSWFYIVDPAPTGIMICDQNGEPQPRILVIEPMSPFGRLYTPVGGTIRPQKT